MKVLFYGFVSFFYCSGAIAFTPPEDPLILTPYIKKGEVEYAREVSMVNSIYFKFIESYSGFLTVKEEYNSNLFFWFFPQPKLENTPWIIWLQGGPGASSLVGLFDSVGPIKIQHGKVELRNVTWANNYSILFVDNPVGSGFSFTSDDRGYTTNEDDVGAQLYEFLQQFLELFPGLREAPLFIAGESYAGKYVPALAIQIHRRKDSNKINLRGISIGNGLIDPKSMMHYSDLCRALGILDDRGLAKLKILEESVVKLIDEHKIEEANEELNRTVQYMRKHGGVSIYNFNKDPSSSVPEFKSFVNRSDVRKWIHVGNASFDLDNQLVYDKMLPDIMNTTKPFVEELLEHYAVMSYSGQLDVIAAYSLSKHLYASLHWSRRQEYEQAHRWRVYNTDKTIAAYVREGGNFVEVLIRNAGHMVPVEQPATMKRVLDIFINKYK